MRSIAAILTLACSLCSALAQTETKKDYSADVKTVNSTVLALYDVISGGKGVERDWDRFRNLFAPGARMVPTLKTKEGKFRTVVFTPEDYVARSGPYLKQNGFFEKEIGRKSEVYGPIAHVFTSYESRNKVDDEKPFEKGINDVQLTFDGDRWWIQSITWAGEETAGPIPKEFLKKGG